MWKADEVLLDQTREILADLLSGDPTEPDGAELLLIALGTLVYLDREDEARDFVRTNREKLAAVADAYLDSDLAERLDQAAVDLLQAALLLPDADDDVAPGIEEDLVGALSVRERVELALEGVLLVSGAPPELSADQGSSLDAFDEVAVQELWRTLPLGDRRMPRCAWASPRHRARLWWWSRGADLPASSLRDLETAARVLAVFPQARQELERAIEGQALYDQVLASRFAGAASAVGHAGIAPQNPAVFAWLASFLAHPWNAGLPSTVDAPPVPDAAPGGRLACASNEPGENASTLIARGMFGLFDLSVRDDAFLVDLLSASPPAEADAVVIEAAGQAPVSATPDPDIPGRFAFPLDHPVFRTPVAVLVVRAMGAECRLDLPLRK